MAKVRPVLVVVLAPAFIVLLVVIPARSPYSARGPGVWFPISVLRPDQQEASFRPPGSLARSAEHGARQHEAQGDPGRVRLPGGLERISMTVSASCSGVARWT